MHISSAPPPRPRSKTDLFWTFSLLALQGFGGVVAVVQRELVDKKQWLTREEFVEEWAVAQILPGPNVVNLSLMIGDRYFGMAGALCALAGMLTFPLLILLVLVAALGGVADAPAAQGALRGMGAVAAGLIAASGFKLMGALRHNAMGQPVCWALALASLLAITVWHVAVVWVLLVLGGLGCAWAWRQLGRVDAHAAPKAQA